MDKKELNDLILSTFKGLEDNNFATLGRLLECLTNQCEKPFNWCRCWR